MRMNATNLVGGLLLWLLLPTIVFAQDGIIEGTVTDGTTGESLPGATILVEGTDQGTATNVDGSFRLENVPTGEQIVVISFVGYETTEQEVTVAAGEQTMDFTLQQDRFRLEDVVVTGVAAETPQRKVPFSIGRVGEEQLSQVPSTNAASALQGKMAGVRVVSASGRPGTAADIRLRGSTAMMGSQQPLIIVDGVILDGSLIDINSEDIESMEVLKGAAAASLYGSRAANGVIQIQTRRGSGLAEGQTRVNVRNEFGVSQLSREFPVSEHHHFEVNEDGTYALDGDGNRQARDDYFAVNPYHEPVNLQREVFRPGNFYTNHVSVGRNTEGGNYQLSFSNQQQEGILEDIQAYGRQNLRVNVDQDILSNLKLSFSGSYAQSDEEPTTQGPGSPFFTMLMMEPHADIYAENEDGTPFKIDADPYVDEPNPLYALHNEERDFRRTRILGDVRVDYQPLDWLNFEASYSMDRRDQQNTQYTPRGYLSLSGPGGGSLNKRSIDNVAQNLAATTTLNHTFGDLITRLRLSYLYEDRQLDDFTAAGSNFAVDDVPRLNLTQSDNRTTNSWQEQIKTENIFAIIGFDWRDRYILDMLVRRDGSSEFGADYRYATYYRVSGAYRLTEDFSLPGIEELRLRGSYGTAGLRPDFEAQYETFGISGGAPVPQNLGNRDLRPAFSEEMELGVNVEFLERFNLELTYADNVTKDQIIEVPLSAAAGGFSNQWQNAGTLSSRSYEAQLGAVLLQGSNMSWQVDVNVDRIRQTIEEITFPERFVGPSEQNAAVFYLRDGETFGVMYGRRWARSIEEMADNPAFADLSMDELNDRFMVNNDGLVVEREAWENRDTDPSSYTPFNYVDEEGNEVFKIGDTNPDFTLGFGSTLTYGGFSLYTLFDWTQGGEIYNQTRQWIYRENRHADFDQSGVPEDERQPVQYYSAIYDGNNTSDYFVEDATFLKVREVALSYQFGGEILGALNNYVESVQLGITGRNLFTFTSYTGWDPEVSGLSGDASNYRFDGYGYPNFRTFTGSLSITF